MPMRRRWNLPWPSMRHDVAQSVLAAVAAVELQARRAGRQIQFVVRDEHLFRRDLPVAQRRGDRCAARVHERRRLEQPQVVAAVVRPSRFRRAACDSMPKRAAVLRQRVDKPEPGVVPGPDVFGPGVAEADDQAQGPPCAQRRSIATAAAASDSSRAQRALLERRLLLLVLLRRSGGRGRCSACGRSLALRQAASGGLAFGGDRCFLDFFLDRLGDGDGDVVLLAEAQLRNLHAGRQLEVGQVDDVADARSRRGRLR